MERKKNALKHGSFQRTRKGEFLPSISPAMFNFVDNADAGTGLLRMSIHFNPFEYIRNESDFR